jgi:hypothetical protein
VSRLTAPAGRSRISSTLISIRSVRRCLPLFVSTRPRTPLRVLCVMAFDALHQLRYSKPLPVATQRVLAALLDFGACTNAIFDEKPYRRKELELTRQILDEAGLHSMVEDVMRRLSDLEGRRPSPFGDDQRFHDARSYREAVARLWLGTVTATAAASRCLEEGILATYRDDVLELLFRIVMQCQIIDDVLDYSRDASAGLPSFLTASASLPVAIDRTYQASCEYAHHRDLPRSDDLFPLRTALDTASICAKLLILLRRWTWACLKPATSPRSRLHETHHIVAPRRRVAS